MKYYARDYLVLLLAHWTGTNIGTWHRIVPGGAADHGATTPNPGATPDQGAGGET